METMKLLKIASIAIVINILLLMNGSYAQTPTILIDGVAAMANNVSVSPYWLHTGQTLAVGTKVNSISVLQYKIITAAGGVGHTLQFDSSLSITTLKTVPANETWKIESVALDPTASPIMQGIQGVTGPTGATGLNVAVGATGNVLTSDGANWTSAPAAGGSAIVKYSYRGMTAASGTQTIPHGLGKTPTFVSVDAVYNGVGLCYGKGIFDGTNQNSIGANSSGALSDQGYEFLRMLDAGANNVGQTATITVDATNIYLAWTKLGSPTAGDIKMIFEIR